MQKKKILETTPKYWQIYENEILPILKEKEGYRRRTKFLCEAIRIFAISQIFMPYFWPFALSLLPKSIITMIQDIPLYAFYPAGYIIAFLYSIIFPSYLILELMPQINGKFLKEIKVLVVTKILKLYDNIKWSYNTEIITSKELYHSTQICIENNTKLC